MQISQQVRVRGSRWRIADIRTYDDCRVVTLAAADVPHREQTVLAPFDDIEPIPENRRPRFTPRRTWWRALRTLLADDAGPASVRSVHRARIEIMPHQLEPALAILRGLGSRVLLADEVGLGKTIQAGIIVSELCRRGAADRVLVIAPAGLREQWCEELAGRFRLSPFLADAGSLRRRAATLPVGLNPWLTARIAVASVDYIKRPEVLPAVAAVPWDVVIVDEAHATAGDSDRQSAVGAIAARASYVLLLTGTPHSGDARSFASLCRCGEAGDELLVFRRRRSDVRSSAIRKVHTVPVRTSPQERRLHALLDRYVAAVRAEQHGAWLAASVLHKRALSSAWSLARSVERRLTALAGSEPVPSGRQLQLPFANADGEFAEADDEPAWPAGVGLADVSREMRLLGALLSAARAASVRETKLNALARLLRRAGEPAIVFTEYRDTLLHMRAKLSVPAAVLHGGLTREQRAAAIREFVSGRRALLLATDAGAEGLNLQHGCRLVINLELPWNPMRLEQRIGRVDRVGQCRTVHAFHLVSAGTAERRILARLKSRVARAALDIGAPDPVGATDEHAVARLVVLGTDPDAEPPGSPGSSSHAHTENLSASVDAVSYIRPDLGEAAQREADRLTLARCLINRIRRDDSRRSDAPATGMRCNAERPCVCRAKRAALRAVLHGGVLMLWRIACEDSDGRLVESLLVPVIADLNSRPERWTSPAIDDLRRCIEPLFGLNACGADTRIGPCESRAETTPGGEKTTDAMVPPCAKPDMRVPAYPPVHVLDATVARWHADARDAADAFWSARLSRERAIESHAPGPRTAGVQPGLFDRRAERLWLAAAAVCADADIDRRIRHAGLERASIVHLVPPQLLLVLLP